MATINLIQDTRQNKKKNRTVFPIKARVIHRRIPRDIHMGFSCPINQWDGKELIKPFPNLVKSNNIIRDKFTGYEKALLDNEDQLDNMTIDQVMGLLVGYKGSLFEFWESHIKSLLDAKRDGTAETHIYAFKSILKHHEGVLSPGDPHVIYLKKYDQEFKGKASKLKPSDITVKFLEKYTAAWKGKPNGVSVYLRALMRIINLCIEEKLLHRDRYPFKNFRIPGEKTPKRAVKKDVINLIRNVKLTGQSEHHRNYFMLMFNLMGMNFVDIANLKKENIIQGRVLYKRTKTKGSFNIKITPEAQRILDLYKSDSQYLLPIIRDLMDNGTYTYRRYKLRLRDHNKYLKKIAKGLNLDAHITSYVVRHSWATIAKTSGVSTTIIQEGLGHETQEMTQVYLDEFENDVMDQANEKITGQN